MSNAIQPLASKQGSEQVALPGARASAKSATQAAPTGNPAAHPPFCLNPSLHIDGALGLVVMEFYGSDGTLSTSIPTVHQLDAYRRAGVGPSTQAGADRTSGADASNNARNGAASTDSQMSQDGSDARVNAAHPNSSSTT